MKKNYLHESRSAAICYDPHKNPDGFFPLTEKFLAFSTAYHSIFPPAFTIYLFAFTRPRRLSNSSPLSLPESPEGRFGGGEKFYEKKIKSSDSH